MTKPSSPRSTRPSLGPAGPRTRTLRIRRAGARNGGRAVGREKGPRFMATGGAPHGRRVDRSGRMTPMTEEGRRLEQARHPATPWKKWGPYLSERQWGTVREDYSDMGNAWDYFSHDQSRSRAYRWGEDGLAGISDDRQILCFALALWNGVDPIMKERVFGLTNGGGNQGEDVQED